LEIWCLSLFQFNHTWATEEFYRVQGGIFSFQDIEDLERSRFGESAFHFLNRLLTGSFFALWSLFQHPLPLLRVYWFLVFRTRLAHDAPFLKIAFTQIRRMFAKQHVYLSHASSIPSQLKRKMHPPDKIRLQYEIFTQKFELSAVDSLHVPLPAPHPLSPVKLFSAAFESSSRVLRSPRKQPRRIRFDSHPNTPVPSRKRTRPCFPLSPEKSFASSSVKKRLRGLSPRILFAPEKRNEKKEDPKDYDRKAYDDIARSVYQFAKSSPKQARQLFDLVLPPEKPFLSLEKSCSMYFQAGLSERVYQQIYKYLDGKVKFSDVHAIRSAMKDFVPKISQIPGHFGAFVSLRAIAELVSNERDIQQYAARDENRVLYFLISGDGYTDFDVLNARFKSATQLCVSFAGAPGTALFHRVNSVKFQKVFSFLFGKEDEDSLETMFSPFVEEIPILLKDGLVVNGKKLSLILVLRFDLKFAHLFFGVVAGRCLYCHVLKKNMNNFLGPDHPRKIDRNYAEMMLRGKSLAEERKSVVKPAVGKALEKYCQETDCRLDELPSKKWTEIRNNTPEYKLWKKKALKVGYNSAPPFGFSIFSFIPDQLHLLLAMILMFEKIAVRRMVECHPTFSPGMARSGLKALKKEQAKIYKRHTKRLKIHRKVTGLVGSSCEQILAKHEAVFSLEILSAADVEKFKVLFVLFKKIRKAWNSKERFSDSHVTDLQKDALEFGRALNLFYPFTTGGKVEYLHYLVDHVGELADHHRILLTGSCQSTEGINAIQKRILRHHIAKGDHPQNLTPAAQAIAYALKVNSSIVRDNAPPRAYTGRSNLLELPRRRSAWGSRSQPMF
jgi:hypothetical protein